MTDTRRPSEDLVGEVPTGGTDPDGPDGPGISRRRLLRVGALGAAALGLATGYSVLAPDLAARGLLSPAGLVDASSIAFADSLYDEVFPTSPLVLDPFRDPLTVPRALAPVAPAVWKNWSEPPGPGPGQQSSLRNERHQLWPDRLGAASAPEPVVYAVDLLVRGHSFTTSQVLPINRSGQPTVSFDASGARLPAGQRRTLPLSTIYGFNGTFPGPMINAEYGRPVLVRFRNRLDENPLNLDRQDFGAPDASFLTHLHNGHTAPESDGNPFYSMRSGPRAPGYATGQWVDNLYLNWPAGGDDREKQSFLWFHDHRMDHTGSNVYKGMVGLYPIYDPKNGTDAGDERQGLRLPGVRTARSDGAFDVAYDIPLALSDIRLDDGVTDHHDVHDREFAAPNPQAHPEWWGRTFYKHFPNHGFVGDLFTVNGTAYPVLEVKRRKYRLRFLDASVARIYELALMSSTQGPKSAASLGLTGTELQGQYRIPDGQRSMRFTEIASDGGLLPFAITRDTFEIWPAKRREVIVDFTRYLDGSPTTKGDVVYLTNVMKMPDGRMWSNSSRTSTDPAYKVPILKIVIGDTAPDDSVLPAPGTLLREVPPLPTTWKDLLRDRLVFEVQRGSGLTETEWLVNGHAFATDAVATSLTNPAGRRPPASQRIGSAALWEVRNASGGWVHPIHLHQEEHRVVMRDGRDVTATPGRGHPDDRAREDVVALDPGESVIVFRRFRDFTGPYVGHCHNLAHEDHAMMFGWEIAP